MICLAIRVPLKLPMFRGGFCWVECSAPSINPVRRTAKKFYDKNEVGSENPKGKPAPKAGGVTESPKAKAKASAKKGMKPKTG